MIYVRDRRKPRTKRKELPPVPNVRVGFSVSKKVGNAVVRNRVKRRLKAALAPLIKEIKPGHNLIIIARAAILDEPFLSIEKTLVYLLKKADLLEKKELRP